MDVCTSTSNAGQWAYIFPRLLAHGIWQQLASALQFQVAGNIFFNYMICETCKQTCLILRRSQTWAPIHQFAVCNPISLEDTNPGSCDASSLLVAHTEDRNSSSCLATHATSATVAAAKLRSDKGVLVEAADELL